MKSGIHIQRSSPDDQSKIIINSEVTLDDAPDYSDKKRLIDTVAGRIKFRPNKFGCESGFTCNYFGFIGYFKEIDSVGRQIGFLFITKNCSVSNTIARLQQYSSAFGYHYDDELNEAITDAYSHRSKVITTTILGVIISIIIISLIVCLS